MTKSRRLIVTLAVCGGVALLTGCPQTDTQTAGIGVGSTQNTTNRTTLTGAESGAVDLSALISEAFNSAAATASATTGGQEDAAQNIPTGQTEGAFGSCPQVTLATEGVGSGSLSATIDFGDGCAPFGSSQYTCSGSASGSFAQNQSTVEVSFDNLNCNDQTLAGEAELAYDISTSGVGLNGAWNLQWTSGASVIETDGNGDVTYDADNGQTTISSFAGSITDNGAVYTALLTGMQVSYATYENFVPFAGTMTLTGEDIRSLTVTFNSDSPTSGEVAVSVNGSPAIEVNLFEL
jgi:hypothetical protein